MNLGKLVAIATAWLASFSVHGQHYMAGDIHVEHAYARATVPHQPVGAVYLSLENTGDVTERLVRLESPVAARTEIHSMTRENNVMKMRQVERLELKPDTRIEMRPGDGYHIMLQGLKQQLRTGEKFALTLFFEKAGKLELQVPVQAMQAAPAQAQHGHRH